MKLSSGAVIFVPMRVIKDVKGIKVIFTLFQTADMPDDKFAEDAKSVKHPKKLSGRGIIIHYQLIEY